MRTDVSVLNKIKILVSMWPLIICGAIGLTFLVMGVRAFIVCSPQAGKWLPWTGTVCYGEEP